MKFPKWPGLVLVLLMWSLPAQAAGISPAQTLKADAVMGAGLATANVIKVRHRHRGLAAGIAFGVGVLLLSEMARERRRRYRRSHVHTYYDNPRWRCRRWLRRCDRGVRRACRKYYNRCY